MFVFQCEEIWNYTGVDVAACGYVKHVLVFTTYVVFIISMADGRELCNV